MAAGNPNAQYGASGMITANKSAAVVVMIVPIPVTAGKSWEKD